MRLVTHLHNKGVLGKMGFKVQVFVKWYRYNFFWKLQKHKFVHA